MKSDKICERIQANYRARGGEWAQPLSLTEYICVPDALSSTNKQAWEPVNLSLYRLQQKLGYLPPVDFEMLSLAA